METIGFIGAGRLGTAFGIYLARRGRRVAGYYSRTYAHAQKASAFVSETCQAFQTVRDLLERSDWIAITTNDGAIERVTEEIVDSGIHIAGKLIFHMSGAGTSELLAPLTAKGALVASLHPLQTFADGESGARAMEEAMFSIEGEAAAVEMLSAWLDELGRRYFVIDARQKPLYHAAASIASNGLVGVIDYALELMKLVGIEEEQALPALVPLIKTTVQNVAEKGTVRALTGPVARGDVATVATHITAIQGCASHFVPGYRALGQMTLSTARRAQLKDQEKITELTRLFE
ncbi:MULTISPECIES: Rossmann-like and DUF2520 domain-containing protein [Aneurinibacillus]|uniref:DUF2520 domain-containing protein n=1 Tax=Aneurinibacillus thermoaerophilus TaxID=143495 RepID=A0A1G7XS58_ANETH|nr:MULTISPECIES: Rossmann-like and DUF2520 domain-containing protein [Aneurinibacillus]AMA73714.1 hypothetical protein ACH33_13155 [Aneurinibacillus sp. XH2]MED0677388.1 DUF2520 domain-containing protein [Aneurinibacillus thermoaerophilus]MED0679478.1 DUF2520 domain-containing protein [Aneurinibacillus thermoaerophilus]MED0737951.1 DUF2520 domain-containing protein [Aneurinibacillus thermoaerophilus]MED0756373.1 DUF2520 domain-containing protein [Aneurinibacillus thermoaerophilus]